MYKQDVRISFGVPHLFTRLLQIRISKCGDPNRGISLTRYWVGWWVGRGGLIAPSPLPIYEKTWTSLIRKEI